eukprot:s508_g15.t1
MKDFTLPFKPEELLARPADGRLWVADVPDVESWSEKEVNKALDGVVGRLLTSQGKDLAEDKTFSLLFAILQSWQRLDEALQPRVVDLLTDAAKRLGADAQKLRKSGSAAKGKDKSDATGAALRNASKVAAFFLRWTCERLLTSGTEKRAARPRRGKGTALQQAGHEASPKI